MEPLEPYTDLYTSGRRIWMAQINMIPFIDIVLVLLVIFMITAPFMVRGMDVQLPVSKVNSLKQEERALITVDRRQRLFLDQRPITLDRLQEVLHQRLQRHPNLAVYLQADRRVPYGVVIQIMDRVRQAGVERVGMVTEAPRENRS